MDWRDPLCEAFMEGAVSLGIPRNPDYNGAKQEGVSYCQRTINNGLRVSGATKIAYDLLLYRAFVKVGVPEENA